MNAYLLLAVAIACEIFATSMMKASAGFTKFIPGILSVVVMGTSFYLLSQVLNQIPLSIAYAIWSGVGTALTALVGIVIWKETINMYTLAGIVFIIIGVVLLNLKGPVH